MNRVCVSVFLLLEEARDIESIRMHTVTKGIIYSFNTKSYLFSHSVVGYCK